MREQSSTSWKRRGSSVVFDREALAPLIGGEAWMVPLRQALAWREKLPVAPPAVSTILITGLEAVLEGLSVSEAEAFLEQRIGPLLEKIQHHWNNCGIVFGFAASDSSLRVTGADEQIVFNAGGGKKVCLSQPLWNGSATLNLSRLFEMRDGKQVTLGYHVMRIS